MSTRCLPTGSLRTAMQRAKNDDAVSSRRHSERATVGDGVFSRRYSERPADSEEVFSRQYSERAAGSESCGDERGSTCVEQRASVQRESEGESLVFIRTGYSPTSG
jgi:hypothetical protein